MRRAMAARVSWLVLALVCVCSPAGARAWNRLPPGPRVWGDSGRAAIRGITIGPIESSQQAGRGYGTPYSAELLDELAAMGTNWVSITPFGRIFHLQDTQVQMDFEAPYEENREAVKEVIRQAKARGMNVLLIPHLWVDSGGWRGEIEPGTAAGWAEYQRSYRDFVLRWARDGAEAGADAFSIGVECKSFSSRFGPFWRALIADVRAVFAGILTYSANWDEAEDVIFWDQLDLVGINAFYPLADHEGATYAEYLRGATRAMRRVRDLAKTLQMPVLFVEIGYTTRRDAAVQPWLWPDDMRDVVIDEAEQTRALAALIEAFAGEPWFVGFFVWRYYANLDDVSQEAIWGFSPHGKSSEPFLRSVFASGFGADPDPWAAAWEPQPASDGRWPWVGLFRAPGDRPAWER